MVQGASQVAARFPELMRMYKAPPPEISTEQFYETDERRGFARGFSIQTLGPLPIEWAAHILAEGHWGQSLREYMRDYNHWTVLGALCELLPQPENRVALADETDANGMPVAHFNYSLCDNDRANVAYAKKIIAEIWDGADTGNADDRPLRAPRRRLPDGLLARGLGRRLVAPRVGLPQPPDRGWLGAAHAGRGEPGARDHGAVGPPREAACGETRSLTWRRGSRTPAISCSPCSATSSSSSDGSRGRCWQT